MKVAIDDASLDRDAMQMKRTALVLDQAILAEAHRLSGERTKSRTVERALSEFARRRQARNILDLVGTGAWPGDLAVMREDRLAYHKRQRRIR